MIQPFWGELGLVPAPLEVSHNYCSNKCAYCFANLNNPNRKVGVKKLFSQLNNYHTSPTFVSQMLRSKMVVAVSNKTDPFALSNYKIAVQMLEIMAHNEIPVFLQTRGGKGVDDVLSFLPKSVFYVSITHTNDEVCKLIEPAAILPNDRWELVKKLQDKGHEVMVACNPYNTKWIDNKLFLEKCKEYKPSAVVLQLLHLNAKQISNMTEREKANMTEDVLKIARKRSPDDNEYSNLIELHKELLKLGIKVKNYNAPELTNDACSIEMNVYGKERTFMTNFQFSEHCKANLNDNDLITFDYYYAFMMADNPLKNGKYPISSYLTSQSKAFRNGVRLPTRISYKEIFATQWNDENARRQINNNNLFAGLVMKDAEGLYTPTDENNNMYFVFNKNGFNSWDTEYSNQIN